MNFQKISQPTLLLDTGKAKANLDFMLNKVAQSGVRFRPHFKTHQSIEIGEWFRAVGVQAITVSSPDMAEYFANGGWQDILIAFPLNIRQVERLQQLAQRIKVSLLVENKEEVQALRRIPYFIADIWIKVDAGAHRTGVDWQATAEVMALCEEVIATPGLRLRGLLTHSGNTYHCNSKEETISAFRAGVEHLNRLRDNLGSGSSKLEISVGDTPGCSLCDDFSGIDELRPGNFIFYDAQQAAIGSCQTEQIAVALACPVVALHTSRNEAVVYGGAIHLSKDWIETANGMSFGLVAREAKGVWSDPVEGAFVRSLSQEHGVIYFEHGLPNDLRVGDLLFVLPAHSCLTVQAMRDYLTLSGKKISTMNS